MRLLRQFLKAESGAITVDWVMLTAAIIAMSLIVFVPLFTSADGVANQIAGDIIAAVQQ